jgi:hypothetical protein
MCREAGCSGRWWRAVASWPSMEISPDENLILFLEGWWWCFTSYSPWRHRLGDLRLGCSGCRLIVDVSGCNSLVGWSSMLCLPATGQGDVHVDYVCLLYWSWSFCCCNKLYSIFNIAS